MLLVPHLGSSSLWDELATLLTVVRRGPVVILTYSNNANNHVLNSLLMWLVRAVAGEGEVQMHLPVFFLGLVTPLTAYWALRETGGRGARRRHRRAVDGPRPGGCPRGGRTGYAGAILCSLLACSFFARLLRGQAGNREAFLYLLSAVAGVGFLLTSVLVPVTHGVVALVLYLRSAGCPGSLRGPLSTCGTGLPVGGALVAILFGLPAPQALAYATVDAHQDHATWSVALLRPCVEYVTGGAFGAVSLGLLALAGAGWFFLRRDLPLCLAFLSPALTELLYLALPNARASPRLLYLLVPPFALGLAAFLHHLASRKWAGHRRPTAVFAWLASATPVHWRLWTVGNPDLKGLVRPGQDETGRARRRTGGRERLLFPPRSRHPDARAGPVPESFQDADLIVNGVSAGRTGALMFAALGYDLSERLDSWHEGGTCFEVYHDRARPVFADFPSNEHPQHRDVGIMSAAGPT